MNWLGAASRPDLEITPPGLFVPLQLRELWRFRQTVWTMAGRDTKLRYKQTALGPAWVVLQPLLSAGLFSFIFGQIAHLSSGVLPYFVFAYAGTMAWNLFSSSLSKCSTSIVGNAHLITKVWFPRLVLPLSTLITTLLDMGISAVVLVVLMGVYRIPPTLNLLALPVFVLLIALLGVGSGLFWAALMVHYRDANYLSGLLVQFLLLASPVAYTAASVPETYRTVYYLNPMASLLEGFRWSCLGSGEVHGTWLAWSAAFSLVTFAVGLYAFRQAEVHFADVI